MLHSTIFRSGAFVICLLATGCLTGLRESPEGTYRGTLDAFTFAGDGTFEYASQVRSLRLVGTWTSTLEVYATDDDVLDDQARGHIDLAVAAIEVDGKPATLSLDSSGDVVYRIGQVNRGWWVHHPDGAIQENEMTIEHNRAGQSRAPFAANFTAWYANPE
jgi:hypothetical protein